MKDQLSGQLKMSIVSYTAGHVVGSPSHKGIARRALPASGGKDEVGGNIKVNKGELYSCV